MDYFEYRAFRKFIEGIENKEYKAILQMAFIEGLRIKEIAERLNKKLVFVRITMKKCVDSFNVRYKTKPLREM